MKNYLRKRIGELKNKNLKTPQRKNSFPKERKKNVEKPSDEIAKQKLRSEFMDTTQKPFTIHIPSRDYMEWLESQIQSLRTEIAELRKKDSAECVWRIDGDEWDAEAYDTSCGNKYVIMNGTPADNNMKFCVYCGKKLISPHQPEKGTI